MAEDLKATEKRLGDMVRQATAQTAAMERTSTERAARMAQMETRLKGSKDMAMKAVSKPTRIAVDLGGGTLAQLSTETLNWIIRRGGDWSGDGFLAHNVDLLQGLPHLILGSLTYVAEMATRKTERAGEAVFPSPTRQVLSEFAKIFSQLGFSNLTRAIRVRMQDGKQTVATNAALQAENEALQQKVKDLQAAAAKK